MGTLGCVVWGCRLREPWTLLPKTQESLNLLAPKLSCLWLWVRGVEQTSGRPHNHLRRSCGERPGFRILRGMGSRAKPTRRLGFSVLGLFSWAFWNLVGRRTIAFQRSGFAVQRSGFSAPSLPYPGAYFVLLNMSVCTGGLTLGNPKP